jgi:hypothetical protein
MQSIAQNKAIAPLWVNSRPAIRQVEVSDIRLNVESYKVWKNATIYFRGNPVGNAIFLSLRESGFTNVPSIEGDVDGIASLSTFAWTGAVFGQALIPCIDEDYLLAQVFDLASVKFNVRENYF